MSRTIPIRFILLGGLATVFAGMGSPASAQPTDPIQRGEYLARAGDCISCHTSPGGTPYAGGLRMKTPFGDLLTPNITPDRDTGIGAWSADDMYRALHDGVGRKVGDLYPAMPYTFFTKITREDSDAIYAYLRSLAPVRNPVDVNQLRWPFDIRWSMGVWRELYFTEGTYRPDPARSAEWNRGAYLVEGLGHCSACHSPRNALGAIEQSKAFTGASIDGWFALNLTSQLNTGLGSWTVDQIAKYLKTGAVKSKSTALGDMAEVVHNSLGYLTDADLRAMATYLKSIPASASGAGKAAAEPVPAKSAKLYLDHCGACHQAKGRGISGVFPPLAGNGAVVAADPANILMVVLKGVPARNGYVPMPSFADQLSDQQIADVANYVRTSWGNGAAGDVTAEMVRRLRVQLWGGAGATLQAARRP